MIKTLLRKGDPGTITFLGPNPTLDSRILDQSIGLTGRPVKTFIRR